MTTKPVIFFSHASSDAKALAVLKERFVDQTGHTIEVFLSSDGQSIPFGRNWVASIESALRSARIAFVFLTAASARSDWVFFEAGNMYAHGIKVIPVGFLDFDLERARGPLALLQGFNIKGAAGLNNLVTIVNEEFQFRHKPEFGDDVFQALLDAVSPGSAVRYAEHVLACHLDLGVLRSSDLIDTLERLIDETKCSYFWNRYEFVVPGFSFRPAGNRKFPNAVQDVFVSTFAKGKSDRKGLQDSFRVELAFEFDHDAADPMLGTILKAFDRVAGDHPRRLFVSFDPRVEMLAHLHAQAVRLQSCGIALAPGEGLKMEGRLATVESEVNYEDLRTASRFVPKIKATMACDRDDVPLASMRRFVEILFDSGVLRPCRSPSDREAP